MILVDPSLQGLPVLSADGALLGTLLTAADDWLVVARLGGGELHLGVVEVLAVGESIRLRSPASGYLAASAPPGTGGRAEWQDDGQYPGDEPDEERGFASQLTTEEEQFT